MKTIILISLFLVFNLKAKTFENQAKIDEYFAILSKEKTDFNPDGAVCERIAVIEIESQYPKENYTIINGIQYDDKKTTIGELDLVIFSKSTGLVEAIGEVKCWKSFEGGLKKAHDQRMRFQTYLNRSITIYDKEDKRYSKDKFSRVEKYFTISQQGGVTHGFDNELSLDLKELMEVRRLLLNCAAEGRCPMR